MLSVRSTAVPRIDCSENRLVAREQFPEAAAHIEAVYTRLWRTAVVRASKESPPQALRTNLRSLNRSCTSRPF